MSKPAGCTDCPMQLIGIGFVPPVGPANARVRFIGEAPGAEEVEAGAPFVGASGQELRRAMRQAGLVESEVYIANTIQCRPPNNDYICVTEAARKHCQSAYVSVHPGGSVVFLVGGTSLAHEWPDATSIETWHGSVLKRDTVTYVPVLHPAGILRGQFEKRPLLVNDIASGLAADFRLPVLRPSFTIDSGPVLALDIENNPDGSVDLCGFSVDGDVVGQLGNHKLRELQPYLDDASEIIAHNASHDYRYLTEAGLQIDPAKLRDTMIAQAMLYSDLEVGLGDALAVTLSGRHLYHKQLYGRHWKPEQIQRCRAIWVSQFPFMADYNESSWYRVYNGLDCASTWRLWQEQKRLLGERLRYFTEVMSPCAVELWQMEAIGLRASQRARRKHRVRLARREQEIRAALLAEPLVADALRQRTTTATNELGRLEALRASELEHANSGILAQRAATPKLKGTRLVRKSSHTAAIAKQRMLVARLDEFNPGSSQQKAWLLYEVLKLPQQRHAKTRKITTDKRALGRLGRLKSVKPEAKQVVAGLVEYEHTNQLRTTFVESKLLCGRLYSSYGLHRTGTGRIASGADADEKAGGSETNQQNWPKELRDIVVPEEGNVFVGGDWSQVEWLLTLWFANDKDSLRRVLEEREDAHRRVASMLYGVHPESVLPEQRQLAKKINHASNYGMGVSKLADEVGISMAEARKALDAIKAAYPLVAKWREQVCEQGYRQKYLQTPFGWRRWFFNPQPDVPKMLAFLPSATGADMLKIRLPGVAQLARNCDGRLLTSTHDSFLIEVPEKQGSAAAEALKMLMERPFSTLGGVSFPAEVKVGRNWQEVS